MTRKVKLTPRDEALKTAGDKNAFVGILTADERGEIRESLQSMKHKDILHIHSDYMHLRIIRDRDIFWANTNPVEEIPVNEIQDAVTLVEMEALKESKQLQFA